LISSSLRYLHLPDDIVNLFITSLPAEQVSTPMESLKAAPSERALMESLDRGLSSAAGRAKIFELRQLVRRFYNLHTYARHGVSESSSRGWKKSNVVWIPSSFIKEKDICMSPVTRKGDVGVTIASVKDSGRKGPLSEGGQQSPPIKKVELMENNTTSQSTVSTENGPSDNPAYRRYLDFQLAK